ncbi:MAG: hypothetical protein M3O82_02840 [Verrucomicrobiota bacterium]|nr:hypothetical protein [Verrucomicrobiota bacterium]
MKRPLTSNTVKVATSFIAMAAWLFVSNHCAIAGLGASGISSPTGHEHCPGHSAPSQEKGDEDNACCKSLQPASVTPAKNLVTYDTSLFTAQMYFCAVLFSADRAQLDLRPLELDTGPPFASSFAESVLQRSILAHAPPFLA